MSGLVVIDGCGANLTSLCNALQRLEQNPVVTSDPETILNAEKIILPGVGAAGNAMKRLTDKGLVDVIASLKQPVLGICVGMQVLFESSEEDETQCIGVVPGRLQRFVPTRQQPVPHMGWNRIQSEHPLFTGLRDGTYFYFVHSFAAPVSDNTIAQCQYGGPFTAATQCKNFLGVQFHPERSGDAGSLVLHNFLKGTPV